MEIQISYGLIQWWRLFIDACMTCGYRERKRKTEETNYLFDFESPQSLWKSIYSLQHPHPYEAASTLPPWWTHRGTFPSYPLLNFSIMFFEKKKRKIIYLSRLCSFDNIYINIINTRLACRSVLIFKFIISDVDFHAVSNDINFEGAAYKK